MTYLSSRLSTITGIIFCSIGVSFLIVINILCGFNNVLPADINIGGFFIAIIVLIFNLKTIYFDKSKLYFKTLFFSPAQEIPLSNIFNIVKAFSFNPLHPIYTIMFYDDSKKLKKIYFVKSTNYLSDDLFEVLGVKNPYDDFSKT